MSVREGGAAEARLSEALRARAAGAAARPVPVRARSPRHDAAVLRWSLLVALLAGAVLGAGLALLSVLAPGTLPPIG